MAAAVIAIIIAFPSGTVTSLVQGFLKHLAYSLFIHLNHSLHYLTRMISFSLLELCALDALA